MEPVENAEAAPATEAALTPDAPAAAPDAPVLGAEPTAEATPAPEARDAASYKITAPEGSQVSQDRLDEIAAYAAERGLSDDQAQDIVQFEADAVGRERDFQAEQMKELRSTWIESLRQDPQYGGERFTKTCEEAKRALDKFATKELKEHLNRTGLGDNKELIITFARIGAQFSEDTLVTGAMMPKATSKSVAELFYGSKE